MFAIGKIRYNQIIGEYVGGVELADTSKYSKHRHNDVMTLLNADHASLVLQPPLLSAATRVRNTCKNLFLSEMSVSQSQQGSDGPRISYVSRSPEIVSILTLMTHCRIKHTVFYCVVFMFFHFFIFIYNSILCIIYCHEMRVYNMRKFAIRYFLLPD